jgi:hypothetical protein
MSAGLLFKNEVILFMLTREQVLLGTAFFFQLAAEIGAQSRTPTRAPTFKTLTFSPMRGPGDDDTTPTETWKKDLGIAGGVVGSVMLLATVCAIYWCCCKKDKSCWPKSENAQPLLSTVLPGSVVNNYYMYQPQPQVRGMVVSVIGPAASSTTQPLNNVVGSGGEEKKDENGQDQGQNPVVAANSSV